MARRLIRPAISNVRARSKRSGEVSYHDSADAVRASASLSRPACASSMARPVKTTAAADSATGSLCLRVEFGAERGGVRRPTDTHQRAQVIEVRAAVARLAKMHRRRARRARGRCAQPQRPRRFARVRQTRARRGRDDQSNRGCSRSSRHVEQHSLCVVELALVGHGEAEVVPRLGFLALELAVDRDLEMFVGVGPTPRELAPPQVEVHQMAERVGDRGEVADRPRFLEQRRQPAPPRRRGHRRTSAAPRSWRRPDRRSGATDARARCRSPARTVRGRARGRPESARRRAERARPTKSSGRDRPARSRRSTARCAEDSASSMSSVTAASVSNASANTSGSSAASAMATCSSRSASAQLVTSTAISASLMRRRARSPPGGVAAIAV